MKILKLKYFDCCCYYSYEQLTKLHPEVESYKLYYAQVSFLLNLALSFSTNHFPLIKYLFLLSHHKSPFAIIGYKSLAIY